MKQYYKIIILSCFVVIIFILINQNIFTNGLNENHIKNIDIAGKIIKVELALTAEEQEKGLSWREKIKDNEGMLFIFKESGKNYFWMKNMNFPIDIIWIDSNFKVIFIKENILPSSYPETFGPDVDNKYVLEVKGGFSKENNLKVGEIVKFLP